MIEEGEMKGIILSAVVVWVLQKWDRRKVYRWLKSNTRDEPHESHVDLLTICKGTRLPEDRVRRACMSYKRIYVFGKEPNLSFSVWRKEPQSVYEKRGIFWV
jgi:hypothetical protein